MINSESFVYRIIFYPCFTKPFLSCIFKVIYLIMMPFILHKSLSLTNINSSLLMTLRNIIFWLQLFSTFETYIRKTLTNLFLKYKYMTHVLHVEISRSIALYIFLDNKKRYSGPYKSIYIS